MCALSVFKNVQNQRFDTHQNRHVNRGLYALKALPENSLPKEWDLATRVATRYALRSVYTPFNDPIIVRDDFSRHAWLYVLSNNSGATEDFEEIFF